MARRPASIAPLIAALRRRGAASAQDLGTDLGLSQPTVSRLLTAAGNTVVRIGRARRSRYAVRRDVRGLGEQWPLYRIDAHGRPHTMGQLAALYPSGSLLSSDSLPDWLRDDFVDGLFPGLPWFLDDQRPQGFLGRQFAQRWSGELGLPADILQWTDDSVLAALLLRGEDGPGNFVLGEAALARALHEPPAGMPVALREQAYARLAEAALAGEPVGSSAAGEQPKFTATVVDANGETRHVIVKFSEPVDTPGARRWADLLVCEHLASELLVEQGHASARTELVWSHGRACLEATRFDRVGVYGRRGFVTLAAWSDAHDGVRDTWPAATARMQQAGWLSAEDQHHARQRWWFGRMIGNTDMHFGNLGFFLDDTLPLRLAPSYDMLPMLYRPSANGAIVPREYAPAPPLPEDMPHWQRAAHWAEMFWRRVGDHAEISGEFRAIAQANAAAVLRARERFAA